MLKGKTNKPAIAPKVAADSTDNRENQLLAIARALLAKNGYDRTSLRDIAEAANVTTAALYYYFPNKDALFERVMLESLQSLYEDVSAAVAKERAPTERIRAFMRASATAQDSDRDRWVAGSNAFLQGASSSQQMAALGLRDRFEALLRQCIAEGVASGELRPVDPAIMGRFLLSGLNQIPRWLKPGGKYTAVEAIDQYVDLLLRGALSRQAGNTAEVNSEASA